MAPPGEIPSNNLWVGNIAPDVTDADLTSLFQKYGQLDSVTAYSSRGFGFLYFKNINDSKEAKDALQGSLFHGNPLRIEFAKPVCVFDFLFILILIRMDFCCLFINYLLIFLLKFSTLCFSVLYRLEKVRTLRIKTKKHIKKTTLTQICEIISRCVEKIEDID